MKKSVLELGGSDAFIVLEDADIDAAAKGAVDARLLNSGQSCINGKRFIVVRSVAKEFTEKYVREMGKKKVGDPLDPKTDIGPSPLQVKLMLWTNRWEMRFQKEASLKLVERGSKELDRIILPR